MSHTHKSFFVLLYVIVISEIISNTNGFTMKMIPIDSPHLQFLPNSFTADDRHLFLVNMSVSRALNYYRNDFNGVAPNGIKLPLYPAEYSYFSTELAFGDGPGTYTPLVLLETSSSETWIQCEGCDPCFPLATKNFAYKESTSFTLLSVHDAMCVPPSFNFNGSCGLSLEYTPDASTIGSVTGLYGKEKFYFKNPETGKLDSYPEIVFGCGLENKNVSFGSSQKIAGIFGASLGPRSFLNQLSSQIKGRFSYCIASTEGAISAINFGDDAQIRGDDKRQVQTISMHSGVKYFLSLSGISVEENRLPIDASICKPDPHYSNKGFDIDSGTPFMMLQKSAYDPLRNALAKYFSDKYGWQPLTKDTNSLCYSQPDLKSHDYPDVTLHFLNLRRAGEIDMVLGRANMFNFIGEHTVCVAMTSVDDHYPSILGAYQQAGFMFLYEVDNGVLSFVPQNCTQPES